MKKITILVKVFILILFMANLCFASDFNHYFEGLLQGGNGYFEEASEKFNDSLEVNPAYVSAKIGLQILADFENGIIDKETAINLFRGIATKEVDPNWAIIIFKGVIDRYPEYAIAYHYRAFAYKKAGNYSFAIENYTQAIKLKPDFAASYYNRGTDYDDLNDFDRAIADYTKAIQFNPNYASAYNNRGYAYYCIGEYDKAIADYKKTIELFPDHPRARINLGVAYAEKLKAEKPKDVSSSFENVSEEAEIYFLKALSFDYLEKYDEAISYYSRAIECYPDYDIAYVNRARVYSFTNRYDLAMADVNKAISIDSNFPDSFSIRGMIYLFKKESDNAIADFNKAIELGKDDYQTYLNRAIGFCQKSMFEKAVPDLFEVLKREQFEQQTIHILEGISSQYLYRKEYKKALLLLEGAFEISPYSPALLNNLAYTYAMLDIGIEKARELAKRAYFIDPKNRNIMDTVMVVYKKSAIERFKKYKFQEALDDFQVYLEFKVKILKDNFERNRYR